MKNRYRLLILGALIAGAGISWAGEETLGDTAVASGTKFVRGLGNVLSSPAEIPCTMAADIRDAGGIGALTGFGKGIVFMLRRILVGVDEVGTFIIPMEATLPAVCTRKT